MQQDGMMSWALAATHPLSPLLLQLPVLALPKLPALTLQPLATGGGRVCGSCVPPWLVH